MTTRKDVISSIIEQMIENGVILGEQAGEFDVELEEASGGGNYDVVEAHVRAVIETSGEVDDATKRGWILALDNVVGS